MQKHQCPFTTNEGKCSYPLPKWILDEVRYITHVHASCAKPCPVEDVWQWGSGPAITASPKAKLCSNCYFYKPSDKYGFLGTCTAPLPSWLEGEIKVWHVLDLCHVSDTAEDCKVWQRRKF